MVEIVPYLLHFHRPAITSRNTLTTRPVWFIVEHEAGVISGLGECAPMFGLSPEHEQDILPALERAVHQPEAFLADRTHWARFPSVCFAIETWAKSRAGSSPMALFDVPWRSGAPLAINGLIWMGSLEEMSAQVEGKLAAGFRCLKLKIGALDWEQEHRLIRELRERFGAEMLEIRVDANGAFSGRNPLDKLEQLAELQVHSIEQPVRAGDWERMAHLCARSPLPIALDEELIGVSQPDQRDALLDTIRPQFLILKPSLLGGFAACEDWMARAEARGIGWWATSYLESNVGLNAIAQWVAQWRPTLPQGLGTGGLFTNNVQSPLYISTAALCHSQNEPWDLSPILG